MYWLDHALNGSPDAATLEHIRKGLNIWLNSSTQGRRNVSGKVERARPLALARCLGLPETPERTRVVLRNAYLIQAANLLPTDALHPWRRATALHGEVRKFSRHQWLCWVNLDEPPDYASDVNVLLWKAMRAGGGKLPATVRQYDIILKS